MGQTLTEKKKWDSAIIIGCSMTGLLSARALADTFESIIVIEKDKLPFLPESRKGVPQGRHAHSLLKRGADILEEFFPGFWEEMLMEGTVKAEMSEDFLWYHHNIWSGRENTGVYSHLQSRVLLEWKIRTCLRIYKNISIASGVAVEKLHIVDGNVRGVVLDTGKVIEADLTVDASGRGTRTPVWLEEMGYQKPEKEEVTVHVGYTTRMYRIPKDFNADWKGLLIYQDTPITTRSGAIFPLEGGCWLVTLFGYLGDYPPGDEEGFLEFARSLQKPILYETIKDAEPISPIVVHRVPSSLRHYYNKMPSFPDGLVVLGDALCSFNPVYGQGMTVAAMGAKSLKDMLSKRKQNDLKNFPRQFQKVANKNVQIAWDLATGEDLRYTKVEGKRPPGIKVNHWYVLRLFELCAVDSKVRKVFYQVFVMDKSLTILFRPGVVWRVIKWALWGRRNYKHFKSDPVPGES